MSEHLEIERKYLIAMPDTRALRAACSHVYEMEQTYLSAAPGVTARVRRRQEGERVEYFYTEKEFRTDRTCVERERAVTEEEYHRLLVRRREEGVTLRKTRWCMLYAGRVLEIDVYPFWEHTAVLEIELPDEGAPVADPRPARGDGGQAAEKRRPRSEDPRRARAAGRNFRKLTGKCRKGLQSDGLISIINTCIIVPINQILFL